MITERFKEHISKADSKDGSRWGGTGCTSVEISVMEVEQRASVRVDGFKINLRKEESWIPLNLL